MFKYNIRAALKNLLRFRSHIIISLVGLIIGLASTFVIAAWTIQELQYDKFHRESESIYMVTTEIMDNNEVANIYPETPPPLADALKDNIPGIENSCHFVYLYGGRLLKTDESLFKETGIAADARFFEILNFPILRGSFTSLAEPNNIILTEKLAKRIFPSLDPVGQRINYNESIDLIVSGIIKDVPENSTLKFEYVIPYQIESTKPDKWWQLADATFIKIRPGNKLEEIKQLSQNVFRNGISDEQYNLNMIPFTELRYGAKFSFFNAEHANPQQLIVFISIACLILILSCLNYSNLISAYTTKRRKEVGIRKANGASAKNLRTLFLTESVLLSLVAWLGAIILSLFMIRFFQSIIDIEISKYYLNLSSFIGLFMSIIVVGFISGIYPAIILSSFNPFKPGITISNHSQSRGKLKNAFVLFQFVLSITLLITSFVVIKQTKFMKNFKVGYNKESIIEIDIPYKNAKDFQIIADELRTNPDVEYVSISGRSPVNLQNLNLTQRWNWEGLRQDRHTAIYGLGVDQNYLNVFQIPLVSGRFFSNSGSNVDKVLINEKLAALTGFDNPIGQIIRQGDEKFQIIGILKDFHYQHLSQEIHPLIMFYSDRIRNLFIKTHNFEPVIKEVQDRFTGLSNEPFVYRFVDEEFDDLYLSETKLTKAIIALTFLTIFLSCIGLIGLVTFNTETRTKEIGIRKVHGARIGQIMVLLNTGILKWLIIGSSLSCVISWIVMNKWLESFHNRIAINFWIYLLGVSIITVITILTVSWQSWKAAIQKPVSTLKYE